MADLKRFFKKTVSEDRHKQAASVSVPEGLWIKCSKVRRNGLQRRRNIQRLCVPEMRRIFQNQCETPDQNDRR